MTTADKVSEALRLLREVDQELKAIAAQLKDNPLRQADHRRADHVLRDGYLRPMLQNGASLEMYLRQIEEEDKQDGNRSETELA